MMNSTTLSARASLTEFDRSRDLSAFASAVSLHAHTHYSRESLAEVETYLAQVPLLGHRFVRELQSCLDQEGCARNYERVWWHPPVSPRAVFEPVSPNEARVLQMIADGNSNKDIAGKLNVTEEAVKGQVRNILAKLGAKDRTHAAVLGIKRGIIS